MPSPTARTLQHVRALGAMAEVVEHWNAYARVRKDLFGVGDVIVVWPGQLGVLLVQATTTGNISHRLEKCRDPIIAGRITIWLAAGNFFSIWGWSKKGPRGKVKHWTLTERCVTTDDLTEAAR